MISKSQQIATVIFFLFFIGLAIFFLVFITNENYKIVEQKTQKVVIKKTKNDSQSSQGKIDEEKKSIKSMAGTINSVDGEIFKIENRDGENFELKISKESSFYEQTKIGDKKFEEKKIEISEIPLNQEVYIQYNEKSNELLMVVVQKNQ